MKIFVNYLTFYLVIISLLQGGGILAFADEPEGELYWMVDNGTSHITPQDTISSHNSDTSNTSWNGAYQSTDAACQIYVGSAGDYTNVLTAIDISSSTEKNAKCGCEQTLGGGTTIPCDGMNYTAHLYCNGVQRTGEDTSSCPQPAPSIIDANNFGICEE